MDLQKWRSKAACKDLEPEQADKIFFIERGQTSKQAKLFCRVCSVRQQCLAFSVIHNEVGIWAGYTDNERDDLKNFSFAQVGIFIEVRTVSEWLPTSLFNQSQVQQVVHQQSYFVSQTQSFVEQQRPMDLLTEDSFLDALRLADELLGAL